LNAHGAAVQRVAAVELTEGAGVRVRRTLGTPALRHLDPFLLLDHLAGTGPEDYLAGFPDHPHRGFVTVTYLLAGHVEHRDSLGNRGDLRAGGVQWMKAAGGVIHSEMPQPTDGRLEGFQLWVNLPAANKMDAPAYQDFPADAVPEFERPGVRGRLVAGPLGARRGPVRDPFTDLRFLHLALEPGAGFAWSVPEGYHAFVYVFDGAATVAGTAVGRDTLAVPDPGGQVDLAAGGEGAALLAIAGRPLGEPIVQYGPFVMNTREQVEQALADYRAGRLVRPRPG